MFKIGNIHVELRQLLSDDQQKVYDVVIDTAEEKKGGLFFIYGYGDIEKTFLYQTIINEIHLEGKIV